MHTIEFYRKLSRKYATKWVGRQSAYKKHIAYEKSHPPESNYAYRQNVPLLKELGTIPVNARLSHGLALVKAEEEGRNE